MGEKIYNERIMNARVSAGKDILPEKKAKREKMNEIWIELTEMQKVRARLIYGMLMNEGPSKVGTVADRLGVGESSIYKLMVKMVEMGMLKRTEGSMLKKPSVTYSAYADAELPSEWSIEDVLKEAKEFKREETVPQEATRRKEKVKAKEKTSECYLAQAMSKDFHIEKKDVGAYTEFVQAMAKVPTNNGELQKIVSELIAFAQDRVRNAKVECPACGSMIERKGATGAQCTRKKCIFHNGVDGGTFEMSVRLMESFVKVNGADAE